MVRKRIISNQTNFFLLFHFTFRRVLDNTCNTFRKYLYNLEGEGGGTLGAQRIIIIHANSYNFQIVRRLSFLGALIGHFWDPLGVLNGPQIPRFSFVHPPCRFQVMIIICFQVSCRLLCIYTHKIQYDTGINMNNLSFSRTILISILGKK